MFEVHEGSLITKISLYFSFEFCCDMLSLRQYICYQKILWLERLISVSSKKTHNLASKDNQRATHTFVFLKEILLSGYWMVLPYDQVHNCFLTFLRVSLSLQFSQIPRDEELLILLTLTSHLFTSSLLSVSAPMALVSSPLSLTFLVLFFSFSLTWFCSQNLVPALAKKEGYL